MAIATPLAVIFVGSGAALAPVGPRTAKAPGDRLQQILHLPGGVTVSPAPASLSPAVSHRALDLNAGEGHDPRTDSGAVYGLLTDAEYGSLNAQGRTVLKYVNYPAWVVEYRGIGFPVMCCPYRPGTPPTSHQKTTAQPAQTPTTWVFYSARTGEYLFTVS